MEIAKQIEKLMKRNKVTRLKLSNGTGIPYTTLTQIINGRTKNPQVKALETIAEYFNVSLDYILGKSIFALIESRLSELNMSIEDLEKAMELPQGVIESLDTFPPAPWDYEPGELVDQIARALRMDHKTLASAHARKEPPLCDGLTLNPAKAFGKIQDDFTNEKFDESDTIAAHHDGAEWTEEELEEIERFKEFVKMKREQRNKE